MITFEQVGPLLPPMVVSIPHQDAVLDANTIKGDIPALDVQYGNIWTNIPAAMFGQLNVRFGQDLHVAIFHNGQKVYRGDMPYSQTFGAVPKGKPLAYLNSLLQLSFALNQDDFAKTFSIGTGNDWSVEVTP